jgi:Kdo2-lipid IVA 3' secondary acyltransferase
VREGYDIGITPDGPRGPKYKIQPGIIKLAQLTGAAIMPVHIRYSRAIHFKTWDGFMLPLPFAKVTIIFDTPRTVPRRMTDAEFEQHRAEIERVMIEGSTGPNSCC